MAGKVKYTLTYEVLVPESREAENGEASKRGHVTFGALVPRLGGVLKRPPRFGFRDALYILWRLGVPTTPVEADSWPVSPEMPPRWLTFETDTGWQNSGFDTRKWPMDALLVVSLHFPENLDGPRRFKLYKAFEAGKFQ